MFGKGRGAAALTARKLTGRCGAMGSRLEARIPWIGRTIATALLAAAAMAPNVSTAHPESGFAELVERASPAVVIISVVGEASGESSEFPFDWLPHGDGLREKIEEYLRQQDSQSDRAPAPVEGQGTGFFIDSDGHIVTNDHVVGGARRVTVTTIEGDSYDAEIVGTDPKTDIALIKIEADHELPFISFGNSDEARVGDWVVAIGNQFGFSSTVSVGVISARNRNINAGPYDDYIQTDAAINFGSSGGPLLNLDGQVIGVNTAIFAPAGGSAGLGFAVPSVMARDVVRQLREHGNMRRGWLGVQVQPVDGDLAEGLGLAEASGVLVSDVIPDSPAEDAGIQPGDVILKFDGRTVERLRDFPRMVAETEVGRAVEVQVWREELLIIKATLGLLYEDDEAVALIDAGGGDGTMPDSSQTSEVLGMRLLPLDDRLRVEFGVDWEGRGVIVAEVEEGSASSFAGVEPGFIVVKVGRVEVESVSDVTSHVDAARKAGRETIVMLFSQFGSQRYFPIPLSQ